MGIECVKLLIIGADQLLSSSSLVRIERFGFLTTLFGPLDDGDALLVRVAELSAQPW